MDYFDKPLLAPHRELATGHNHAHPGDTAWVPLAQLNFAVSQDEEHVFLSIESDGTRFNLGERIHHYPLLVLARLRREDACRGLQQDCQGWVDIARLARMVGIDTAYLNIQIFRARRQIAKALINDAGRIEVIQRRRGQVRMGPFAIRIVHGSTVEAAPQPVIP